MHSQNFEGGVLLGVNGSQVDGDEQGGYKKAGLIIGVYVYKPITKNSGLKIETYYVGKGAVLNIDYQDGSIFQEFNTKLHYIELPFLYNLKFHPKINISIGIAPSYLFSHKLVRQYQPIDKQYYKIQSIDVQPMGQISFYLSDHISSELRISRSITDMRPEAETAWFNNNLSVLLKYTF